MSTESGHTESLGYFFARDKKIIIGIGLMLGIILGVVVGAVTENMGFWISMGTTFGLVIGAAIYIALSTGEPDRLS